MTTSEKLCALISREADIPKVTLETAVRDLDLDSLEFVDLMLAIGGEFREVPDSKWGELHTVGDILHAVSE